MKKHIFIFPALLFTLLMNIHNLWAQNSMGFPSLEPSYTFKPQNGIQDSSLNDEEIISAALGFYRGQTSLFMSEQLKHENEYFNEYRRLRDLLLVPDFLSLSETQRAEKILDFIYENILLEYSINITTINEALHSGKYNCVSSSILYLAFAKASGIDARAQRSPSHCFITVYVDGKKIDVETTNPKGFDPGTKKMISSGNSGTVYAIIPKTSYVKRTEISDRMAVSLIARNLSSYANDASNYFRAVPPAVSRYYFLFTERDTRNNDSRNDLDSICINYAVFLQNRKMYFDSMIWIENVINKFGITEKLSDIYNDCVYNSVLYFSESRNLEQSNEIYKSRKDLLSPKTQDEIVDILLDNYISQNIDKFTSPDEEITFYGNLITMDEIKNDYQLIKKINAYQESAWAKKIMSKIKSEKFLEAAAICDEALTYLPGSTRLRKYKNESMYNYSVTVHNSIVPLVNKGRIEDAKKILKEALEVYPESQLLKSDWNHINR